MDRASSRFYAGYRLALLLLMALAALAAAGPARAGLPPLIDREIFFGDPEISGAQISPDGQYISFIKPLDGTRNVWIKKAGEPFDAARPVTADTKRPIPAYFWSRDSKYVLFVQDQGGDENFNVYAVDPAAPPAEGSKVPAARNLTDAKGVRAFIYQVSKRDPDLILVGLNDRDAAWHDVYQVRISTGERTLLRQNTERIAGWVFDLEDRLRLALRLTDKGDTEVLRVDAEGFTQVYSCSVLESCGPTRFHKDGKRVYMETNKGDVDLTRLVLFDPATGKEELVESDPEGRVDFGSAIFSDVTDELVGTAYVDDRTRYYWRDAAFKADYEWLRGQLPVSEIAFGAATRDERRWIVSARSDVEPGTTYLFDRDRKTLERQYRIRERLPREHLASMTSITYTSSDGLEIPAYLTLPKGVPAKNLPLIVFPHGGPWARDNWGYSSYPQFLANRGYAVLQPNFRSSTGFGKKFLNAGNGQWGDLMQDDLTWGVKHLVKEGIVDAKRVGIMGGSYGGYATLAGVAFTPDVYAAGVAIVAPSNLITLLDSIPPYWEAGRVIFHTRMGDPNTPEGRAQLERQSPLNSAAKIKTPLLVVQGANDPRVKKAESDQIVIALRDRNFPVEYIVAPDEGHGFARPVNNMAMMAAAEKFLAKHLQGRHQPEMPPDVEKRLGEITVDPRTVTLQKAVDAAAVGVPKTARELKPGASSYAVSIALGPQTIQMGLATEIARDGDSITITDRSRSPMGEATDTVVLDAATLTVRKRSLAQGPVSISYEVKDGRAVGQMAMGGEPKPIDVELGGELFADGPGSPQVVAMLPLAEGYTTSYRNFDVQSQKVRVMQLSVAGSETVTVPAGSFDAWKVELLAPEDGQKTTLWIAKECCRVARTSSVVPRMNGAAVTAELQP
ncbi:MAG: prolyl oligopeptidase family serine peptidase [Steroidobacteraceae bacterium]|jgi:dipeptidyl aminopeptidase/acylaminoacyl peptidase|nr:prolyl oligopeptidase family serine peptidase [Steroidobacteraceae bacterium]